MPRWHVLNLNFEIWNLNLKSSLACISSVRFQISVWSHRWRLPFWSIRTDDGFATLKSGVTYHSCPWQESSTDSSSMCTLTKWRMHWHLTFKKERKGLSCCESCSPESSLRNTNVQVFYGILLIQKLPLEPLDSFCSALHFCSHSLQILYLKYFVWKLIKMLLWKESATLPPSLCLMAQDLSHKFILIKLRFSRCSLSCNPYVIVPNIFSTIDVTLNRLLLPAILLMALTLFLFSFFSF